MSSIYLQGENGRGIVLFHSYTGTSADVRMLGSALNQLGYAIYMLEFSGHGTPDMRDIVIHDPKQWINEASDAVQFLVSKGNEQVAVFGLSLGGMMAIHLLTQQIPSIIGGGSFNSPVPLGDMTRLEYYFMKRAETLYQEQFGDKEIYLAYLKEQSLKQQQLLKQLSEDIAQKLTCIDVPVYIAQSGKDELIDNKIGEVMANRMPFTTVDYHYFENAKHAITVGLDRKAFQDTVIAFIEQLGWEK